jgi:hypothetical protein
VHSDPAQSHANSRRSSNAAETTARPGAASRRKTLPGQPAEPVFAAGRDRSATITKKETPEADTVTPKKVDKRGREKVKVKEKDDVVVPPINVLIVEGELFLCCADGR